jgi:hypothetical protein
MAKVIVRPKIDCEEVLGQFCDSRHYDLLITEDTDLYAQSLDGELSEENIIFKFRKQAFTAEEQALAYEGLRDAAVQSQNRGLAAGPRGERLHAEGRGGRDWVTSYQIRVLEHLTRPLNQLDDSESLEDIERKYKGKKDTDETRGQVWLRSKVLADYDEYDGWFDRWLLKVRAMSFRQQQFEAAEYVRTTYISDTNYAQSVMSGIAGYYDRYPRIPYGRPTHYTEKYPDKFAKCYPYIRKLDKVFKKELPERWRAQRNAADKLDKKFTIDGTVYTTLTVNHNWRTAAHRDAGDLNAGFSNITAFTGPENKGWQGAEFILPEYRVAIKLAPRDLLLVNNHGGIHANNPLKGDDNDRLTIVAYFREKMLELKSWDYENLRHQYVEERRKNKEHKCWFPLWNGVSPNMFQEQEWYDYLKLHNIEDPYKQDAAATLDSFFG